MLRIIGGDLKRRRLHTPKDAETTRPMPDRVRQALFNLLRGHTEGMEVVDVFAGTGSIGFEALSRGASHAMFVERERKIASLIEKSAQDLGISDRAEVVVGDALGAGVLARCPDDVHLIFFDPPYPLVRDAGQWPRVKAQFSRLVQKLDDTGYAVLRTPWPCFHEVPAEPASESLDPDDDPEETRAPERIDVDLHVDGALGPETHGYGTMALHLYMRDPNA